MLHYHYVTYLYVQSPVEGCPLVNSLKLFSNKHSMSSLFISLYQLVFCNVSLDSKNIFHSYIIGKLKRLPMCLYFKIHNHYSLLIIYNPYCMMVSFRNSMIRNILECHVTFIQPFIPMDIVLGQHNLQNS